MSESSPENPEPPNSARSNSKIVVLCDQAIVSATNFLTTIIIGNACGADQLGIYAVGFSIVLLSMAIEASLVSTPFTVFVQKDSETDVQSRAGSALVNLVIVCLCLLVLQTIAWLVARPFLEFQYDHIFQAILLTTPFFVARGFFRKFLLATFQARKLLVFDFILCTVQVAGLVGLAFGEFITPVNGLLAVGSCNLVGVVLFLLTERKSIEFRRPYIRQQIRKDWQFGKWLVGEHTLTVMSIYGAPWLLALLLNSAATGVFAACYSITGLANPFLIGLGNYLLPRFSNEHANQAETRKTYWYYMVMTFIAMTLFAITCFVFADQLLKLFYPEKSYDGFGIVLAVLAIRVLIGSMGMVSYFALLAMQKPKISLYASIVCITILVFSSLILIPTYGLLGAAIAWAIASVAESLVMIVCFQVLIQRSAAETKVSNAVASQLK